MDYFERLKRMKKFNEEQRDQERIDVLRGIKKPEDVQEAKRQEIIRMVEEHHKVYNELWLSHLKGRKYD